MHLYLYYFKKYKCNYNTKIKKRGVKLIMNEYDSLEFEELKKIEQIAKPLIDFIKQNYNPHTSIVINEDSIKVVTDEINIPLIN